MSAPDETRFEAAFTELAHVAELMVDPVDATVIRGRVRRRRTTRSAVAAALAALLVAAPAVWWLRDSEGEEVDPRPAEETTAESSEAPSSPAEGGGESREAPQGQESEAETVLPTFGDLVGAEIDLPEFFPGLDNLNEACPTGPAVPADGTPDAANGERSRGPGPVWLLKVVHTPLEEGGPTQAVALFGCSPGEAMTRQAVVVAGDGDGGWEATGQVAAGDLTDFPLWDLAPADAGGVLLMVLDQEPTGDYHPDALGFEVFRYRTGEDLAEVTGSSDLSGVTDLSVTVEKTDNGDGTWTAAVTVANGGDRGSRAVHLAMCADASLGTDGPEQVPVCGNETEGVVVLDPLAPGEATTLEWTLTPEPFADWNGDEQAGGLYFTASIQPAEYGSDGFALDTDGSNDYDDMEILVDDMPTS